MAMTAEQYRDQLQALLPRGKAWPREADAVLTALLDGLAPALARADARAEDLLDEADPRTTAELLADWERVAGLPDRCVTTTQTAIERRDALVARITNAGGQSRAFFVALAAFLGYTITVAEYRPFQAGVSRAGDALTNGDWLFSWRVEAPAETVRSFVAGSLAGEPLRSWGNEALECVIRRHAPAHTLVLFTYG